MQYIICYDISDDRRRLKTAGFLEGHGQRVQKSVFECKFPSDKLQTVVKQLSQLIEEEDNIRIYPLCEDCFCKAIGIGEFSKTIIDQGFGIF